MGVDPTRLGRRLKGTASIGLVCMGHRVALLYGINDFLIGRSEGQSNLSDFLRSFFFWGGVKIDL